MSAQDLSFKELLDATRAWREEPGAAFLSTNSVSAAHMPRFNRLHGSIAGAPSGESELARITEWLGEVDGDHDVTARFIIAFLSAFAHDDLPDVSALAARLTATLIPEGYALVIKSYAEEAGSGDDRAGLLTEDVRTELASFPLPASRTLLDKVDALQGYAGQLGSLLQQRRKLENDSTGPTGMDLLNAKRGLIALVEFVLKGFEMAEEELDESARAQVKALKDTWDAAVREATERADRRRRTKSKNKASSDPNPA